MITKTVSAYEARTKLGELMSLVYYQGIEVIVERMGRPIIKLTRIDNFSSQKTDLLSGVLDLAGAWDNKDGEIIEKNAQRLRNKGKLISS